MSSELKGAATEITNVARNAKRCPCLKHSLNNSLKKSNNVVVACKNSVGKMKEVIFFSNSTPKINYVFRSLLVENEPGNSFESIFTYLKALTDSKFIVSFFALGDSPTFDLVNAPNSVRNVLTVLEKKRNEVEYIFHTIFVKAESVAKEMEDFPKKAGTEIITLQTPLKNEILTDLLNRLSEEVMESFHLRCLTPLAMDLSGSQTDEHVEQLVSEEVVKICKMYTGVIGKCSTFVFHAEYRLWREQWVTAKKGNSAIPHTVDNCNKDMFPIIH
ncbi:hypothetical protein PR048_014502 [Dryococelus australis]|uniref:Uncharacterized protein n=1 Tax=Dryococelus australis TaxID=614101 RepID=A0ABQ9HED5_9NEOP|nr:hypothetical protein PR048_014502 [Dryococelus australis]